MENVLVLILTIFLSFLWTCCNWSKFFLKYIGENVMYFKNVFQSTHSPLKFLSSASLTNAFYISSYKYITEIPEKNKPCTSYLFIWHWISYTSFWVWVWSVFDRPSRKNLLSSWPWVDLGWMLGAHQALYLSLSLLSWMGWGKMWVKTKKGRDQSPITVMGKTVSTWQN